MINFFVLYLKILIRRRKEFAVNAFDEKQSEERVKEIALYHYRENVMYKNWALLPNDFEIEDIPIISKGVFQTQSDKWLSSEFVNGMTYSNSTSGSSGKPLKFFKDWECHIRTWLHYDYLYSQHQIDIFRNLEARFYGIPKSNRTKLIKERIKDFILRRVRFSVFDLSDETLKAYVNKFRYKKFVYLNGYASSLVRFAKYLVQHELVLSEICPTLRLCITTSEMCSDSDRDIMQKGFGVTVVNEYGAAELDILAFEDEKGSWILNDSNLYIEIVDDKGRRVKNGEQGKIIVTSLYNRAMPFIRYELGDYGVLKEESENGRRILSQLLGRTNDFAVLSEGKIVPGLTFYYITKAFLADGVDIVEMVVKQIGRRTFEVQYVSKTEITVKEHNRLKELFDIYVERNLEIKTTRLDSIERGLTGKLKQFENLCQ